MSHQLILDLPEDVFDPLADTAKRNGATPEQLAVEWLRAVSRHASRDPVENFIGALPSSVPDWADQHDRYLRQTLTDSPAGNSSTES